MGIGGDEGEEESEESEESSKYSKDDCKQVYRLKYACLCPADYVGESCSYWNPIMCDIEFKEDEFRNCDSRNEFYYNSKFDGDPPCTFID
jgi:hypothetical protein